jgi:hypothetical protein
MGLWWCARVIRLLVSAVQWAIAGWTRVFISSHVIYVAGGLRGGLFGGFGLRFRRRDEVVFSFCL